MPLHIPQRDNGKTLADLFSAIVEVGLDRSSFPDLLAPHFSAQEASRPPGVLVRALVGACRVHALLCHGLAPRASIISLNSFGEPAHLALLQQAWLFDALVHRLGWWPRRHECLSRQDVWRRSIWHWIITIFIDRGRRLRLPMLVGTMQARWATRPKDLYSAGQAKP